LILPTGTKKKKNTQKKNTQDASKDKIYDPLRQNENILDCRGVFKPQIRNRDAMQS